jgi:hypothetical protein
MSQTTGDLYDAFRNIYLALESLLSTVEPVRVGPKGNPEGEGGWLKRALETVEKKGYVSLSDYTSTPGSSTVDDVFDDLYRQVRTSIFHAKNGRPTLLPQDRARREAVLSAKERYTRFYLDIARNELNARFSSGAMTNQGFALMAAPMFDNAVIEVTDDATSASSEDEVTSPAGHAVVPISIRRAPEHDEPMRVAVIGESPVSKIAQNISSIGRITCLKSGDLMFVESFEGLVELSAFDSIECIFVMEGKNIQLPKSDYDT